MADTKKTRNADGGVTMRHPPPASARWEKEGELNKTVRMSSAPQRPQAASKTARGVELLVVDETQLPGADRKGWRAAEIWTKRRVYGLDSTFRCIEILDRETGRPETNAELLGARLGGGRQREKDVVKFSYPYPLPGMEAMFLKGKKHGYTSAVERMIVRIRVLHTAADDTLPTWEEIANRWSDPPPPRAK